MGKCAGMAGTRYLPLASGRRVPTMPLQNCAVPPPPVPPVPVATLLPEEGPVDRVLQNHTAIQGQPSHNIRFRMVPSYEPQDYHDFRESSY